jgi:hypothetical protein
MSRPPRLALLCSFVLLAVGTRAPAQLPDESVVVRNSDWSGMLALANAARMKGDLDLAKRKYLEAWTYARFWAVYNPADRNSGSRRTSGEEGMRQIRRAGAGVGLDDTFRELDDILAEAPPKVLSGGKNNYGLWREEGHDWVWNLKQNGGAISGKRDSDSPLTANDTFEATGFDGTRMQVVLTYNLPGKGKRQMRFTGELTFDGNRLTGKLRGEGREIEYVLVRNWRE